MLNLGDDFLILLLVIIVLLLQYILNWFIPKNWFLLLFNMALLFQGLSIFLLRSKVPEHLGLLLILTSGYYTLNSISEKHNLTSSSKNLSSTFIFNLKQIIPLKNIFHYVGIFIILIVFVRNWLFGDLFGQNDKLLIISAITWITYNHVPPNFNRERDFSFLFINFL